MAVDMFLKVDGIPGESQDSDSNHKGSIDVLAWSWGISQSGTTHMGSGGGSGKASVNDLSITKYVDAASQPLMLNCLKGTHIKEATLTVRKAGGTPLEYIIIKLTDILITSVSTGGSGGEDRLTENVTLNFAKVEYKYTSQKLDGKADKNYPFSWNIPGNSEK